MKKPSLIILSIAVVLLAAGAGFYAGMRFSKSKTPSRIGFGNGQMMQGAGQRQNGGGFVVGEVISKDDQSITVKLRDGGSKIVYVASSTKVGKTEEGTLDDIAQGLNVLVTGTPNADGSVLGSVIQIQSGDMMSAFPAGGMMGGGSRMRAETGTSGDENQGSRGDMMFFDGPPPNMTR